MALQDDAESAFQKAIEDGVQTQWTTLRTAEGPGGAIQAMIDELCANFHNDVRSCIPAGGCCLHPSIELTPFLPGRVCANSVPH